MSGHKPTIVVVPQGAEHQAVLKGLRRVSQQRLDFTPPSVISVPIGVEPVRKKLLALHQEHHISTQDTLLLMGLGGSLVPELKVGAIAFLDVCLPDWIDSPTAIESDRSLIKWIDHQLQPSLLHVKGATSQRLVSSAHEKAQLHQRLNAAIVDMEGYGLLDFCQHHNIRGGVLRIVSDDCSHDVPDINTAINAEGTLETWPMIMAFLQQPIAAVRLIRGALTSLGILETVVVQIFDG